DSTLALASFTHLNCQGYKILPASVSSTGVVRSTPEVALFLHGADGSKIQNCRIGDATAPFDFGIWVAQSKAPVHLTDDPGARSFRGNKILDNQITTSVVGLIVDMADHTHISGNTLASMHGCSTGINLAYDADNNLITDNVVLGSSGTSRGPLIRYR